MCFRIDIYLARLIVNSNRQSKKSSQQGSALIDYALIVILIAIIALGALRQVGAQVSETLSIAGGGTVSTMNNDQELQAQQD